MKLTGSFQIVTVAMVMTLSACSGDSTVLEELADSVASAPAPEVVSSPDVSPLPETEVTPSPESQTNQGIQSAADIEISPLPEQDSESAVMSELVVEPVAAPESEPVAESEPLLESLPVPQPELQPELRPELQVEPENNSSIPEQAITYDIASVDASHYQDSNPPGNVVDELTEDGSRWSAEGRSDVWLQLDLGAERVVNTLDIFFLKNDERNTCFDIQSSVDGVTWSTRRANIVSNGERVFSIPETNARYLRYIGLGNSINEWNSIIEVEVQWLPVSGSEDTSSGVGGECSAAITGGSDVQNVSPLDEGTNGTLYSGSTSSFNSPAENFDLTHWKITYPDASEAYPPAVVPNEFYTDETTGAMVFECVNRGERTSKSTKYARSELREMLRGTDDSIGTKSLGNNWVISTAPLSAQQSAGGVDGNMKVTVAVDAVSTTYSDGNDYMLGRVIVGQIHGSEDEPFKIYYRKLPGNTKGSVYFSYEDSKVEHYYELFGSRDNDASDPADGIALGEKWSYEVDVSGRAMVVTVTKEDGAFKSKSIAWSSEYDDDWFYFKAGNYNQNNGGETGDYAQVSVFALTATHN